MPICRSHKRLLKTTRILKKENHNKEEKSFKVGGTGNGYMRNNMNFCAFTQHLIEPETLLAQT